MERNKILITGANGQLGIALRKKYPEAQACTSKDLDITNREQLDNYNWKNVKTIINAAAFTNVDGAESPDGRIAAWSINANGVANLTKIAIANNITLVHISTDYVFDGTLVKHDENEAFSPLNVYGQSKAAGDISVSLAPKHYILRTSWVIGDGNNFVRTMLTLGGRGISPTVVADQIGRPTFVTELVRIIDYLLSNEEEYGTYNSSNGGKPVNWADFTREIFSQAGYKLTVTNTSTAEYYSGKQKSAARPLNSTFELSKLHGTGFESSDWLDDLRCYIKEELESNKER